MHKLLATIFKTLLYTQFAFIHSPFLFSCAPFNDVTQLHMTSVYGTTYRVQLTVAIILTPSWLVLLKALSTAGVTSVIYRESFIAKTVNNWDA